MSILTPETSQVQTDLAADLTAGAFAFAEAENSKKLAMADFADTKAKFGAKVALALFNLRVSRWANSFTNKRLAEVAYTLGRR